jgi:hypothetical protein
MLVSNTLEEALGEKVQISRRHEERSFSGSRQRSPAGVVDMPRFAWVDVDGGGLAANLLCRHRKPSVYSPTLSVDPLLALSL